MARDDEARCPVCGRANGCGAAAGDVVCWCWHATVRAELVAWLQARGIDASCLCRECAAGAVPSPCVDVCVLDSDAGICTGCRRTLDEIATWSALDAIGRARVLLRLRGIVVER
jgi:predicted Fe-S protein YdhL (DUF1289 family)